MRWLKAMVHFFWPFLEPVPSKQKSEESEKLVSDRRSIETLDLSMESQVALDEVRRIADIEEDRRRGSDQKASTYLAVVATLVPLLVTLATAVWDKKVGSAPTWLNVLILTASVAYVSAAGVCAFRVLRVSVAHRIGLCDVVKAWSSNQPVQEIARKTLLCARLNQKGINEKVTAIKMAHEFLLRAFLSFSMILMFNIAFFLSGSVFLFACGENLKWLCVDSTEISEAPQVTIKQSSKVDHHPTTH